MRIESALKRLAEGEFVCSVRFQDEYEALSSPEGKRKATEWLEAIGYRLARLGEDGAFFMAYDFLDQDAKARVREELRSLRDKLQPVVSFLETLRQAQSRGAQLQPGDDIVHSEIMEAVRHSALVERRLGEMRDVHGSRASESANDRLGRILELLEQEGYLSLKNQNFKTYRVTGKITYLYQLLAFMAEHLPEMAESSVSDQMEEQITIAQAEGSAPA